MVIQLNESLKEGVLELCKDIAGSRQIVAVCLYGPWVYGYADKKTSIDLLLVLDNFTLRLNTYSETVDGVNISILAINRSDFERDVKRGWLGEFFAEKVTFPSEPLMNGEYLRLHEVKLKKRIISELLENLILEFPESSHEFLIKPEYFIYEIMMRKARLFPPVTYSFLNMSGRNLRRKNMEAMMEGYLKALEELAKEKQVILFDGHIKLTRNYIAAVKKRKPRLPHFLKLVQRIALLPILNVFSESATSLIQDQRLFMKTNQKVRAGELLSRLEDPKKYVLLPTPLGSVSLSDKSAIKDVARRIIPDGELSNMRVKNIGGALNDVYLLTLTENGKEQRFVVKRFLDWSNLKWLSLAIWSFGTTAFAVLGQSRLEREYAINKFLHS